MDILTLAIAIGYTNKQVEEAKKEGFKVQVEQDRSILDRQGKEKVFYFLPKSTVKPSEGYDEFVYANNKWKQVGVTDVDLSAYALKTEIPKKTSELQNDSGFLTSHQDVSGKENTSNKKTSISNQSQTGDKDTNYPTVGAVRDFVNLVKDDLEDYVDEVIGGIENGSY